MKERGKPGVLDTTNDRRFPRCLSIDIFVFLCIALYFHYRGFFECGRTWTPPEPNGPRAVFALAQAPQDQDILKRSLNQQQDVFLLHKNSCRGEIPLDPLRSGERKHGEATAGRGGAANDARWACG